ncbi:topless-related protein 2-like isoform X2 [Rosa rugosa]|uniref:topless-related protein 2-like isoform X2 n=1 Tax=Rosa rugosa TaxID=74645 RepID=UPI002B41073E|nr:topless-related protein 2-like isoform X2 [Rosa rugosa]
MERRLVADVPDENKLWQLVEIVDPLHCLVVTMPPYSKEPANKVIRPKFKCHQKHIPGFAFSVNLKVMVSSEADAQSQLRFWNMDTWDKRKLVRIQLPTGKAPTGDTQVQFYSDQILLLVLVKTQPALYDGAKTECIQQWMPRDVLPAPITCAAYSLNNQLYGALSDSNVGVFDTDSLKLRCRIAMSVYFVEASRNRFKVPQPGSNAGIGAVLVTAQEVEAHSEKGLLVGAVAESDATEDPIFPGERMSKMKDAAGVSLRVFLATPGGRFLLLLRLSSTKLLLLLLISKAVEYTTLVIYTTASMIHL